MWIYEILSLWLVRYILFFQTEPAAAMSACDRLMRLTKITGLKMRLNRDQKEISYSGLKMRLEYVLKARNFNFTHCNALYRRIMVTLQNRCWSELSKRKQRSC